MCVAELNFGSIICGSKYLYQFVGIYQYENCRMSLGALSTEGAVQSFLFKIIYPTHAHMYLYIYTYHSLLGGTVRRTYIYIYISVKRWAKEAI